jgi:hypothetical protein
MKIYVGADVPRGGDHHEHGRAVRCLRRAARVLKLTPAARRALVYVATGRALPRNLSTLVGFGELARFGLIEVNPAVNRWRCSPVGRETLVWLRRLEELGAIRKILAVRT